MSIKKTKKSGFTLVEMLIVIVIIGILASALIPRLGAVRGKARDAGRKAAVAQMATAMQIYGMDYGTYLSNPGASTMSISGTLAAGGMDIIPQDKNPSTANGNCYINPSMVPAVVTGYGYISLRDKNNGVDKAFVIWTCPESAGSANRVYCPGSTNSGTIYSTTKVDALVECASISKHPTICSNSGVAGCTYTGDDQVRYIFKYPSDN